MAKSQKLANLVATTHVFWIFVLHAGIIAALFVPWYRQVQMIMATATVTSQVLMRFRCPLTKLEVSLRRRTDPDYQPFASFVQHYLETKLGIRTPKIFGGLELLATTATSWMLYFAH